MFSNRREVKREEPHSSEPEQKSKSHERPRLRRPPVHLNLARGSDGRLRPADEADIGDLWAEQQRIRLHEAIEADKRKVEKKRKRTQDGLFGLKKAKKVLPRALPRAKVKTTAKPAKPKTAPSTEPAPTADVKEVIVSLSLPKLKLPKLTVPRVRLPFAVSKKRLIIGGVLLAAFLASFMLYPKSQDGQSDAKDKSSAKSAASASLKHGKPSYDTILPKGKRIDDLGGWARVSPPNTEPVYAYADAIDHVTITVSQQPLPKSFKPEVATHVADLAKQFTANEKITAGDVTAYVGTSIKGPQSVIFSKDDLLILIKSTGKLTNDQWSGYISTLQ